MTTATSRAADDSLAVSSWLADLRMECYKKNLENYDTVKVSLNGGGFSTWGWLGSCFL